MEIKKKQNTFRLKFLEKLQDTTFKTVTLKYGEDKSRENIKNHRNYWNVYENVGMLRNFRFFGTLASLI